MISSEAASEGADSGFTCIAVSLGSGERWDRKWGDLWMNDKEAPT